MKVLLSYFQYYNHWISLAGTFLCLFVMFAIDWKTAIVTLVCVAILYMYIAYKKPGKLAFYTVDKGVLHGQGQGFLLWSPSPSSTCTSLTRNRVNWLLHC